MYKYVILGTQYDFDYLPYLDILDNQNAFYIKDILPQNAILNFLYRLYNYKRFNKYFELPFKLFWNPFLNIPTFKKDEKVCFVYYFKHIHLVKNGLLDYLRTKYPNSKHVLWFVDLISLQPSINIPMLKSVFDMVISYDFGESKKYDIYYHPTVCSRLINNNNEMLINGVFFIGQVKNRKDVIISCYEKIKDNNVPLKFVLIDKDHVIPESYRQCEDITFFDDFLPYTEVLYEMNKYSTILEIIQNGSTGYTYRTWEAIMYGKKLLSNNKSLETAPFFNEKYIQLFNTADDIDVSFLKDNTSTVNYDYANQISPTHFIDFIETNLNKL